MWKKIKKNCSNPWISIKHLHTFTFYCNWTYNGKRLAVCVRRETFKSLSGRICSHYMLSFFMFLISPSKLRSSSFLCPSMKFYVLQWNAYENVPKNCTKRNNIQLNSDVKPTPTAAINALTPHLCWEVSALFRCSNVSVTVTDHRRLRGFAECLSVYSYQIEIGS